jgi:predicted Zn-dependent protease
VQEAASNLAASVFFAGALASWRISTASAKFPSPLPHAHEVLEANLKSHPGQFSIMLRLGHLYLHSNDAKSAVTQLEAAQLMQPENVEVSVELAKALIEEGQETTAIPLLERVVAEDPLIPHAQYFLGVAYKKFANTTKPFFISTRPSSWSPIP